MTADADRHTVAARLAAERTRRGLTKRELGRRLASQVTEQCPSLDTLVSYVKRWEAGKVSVSDRYRHAYSKALGMSPADLFGRAGRPPPSAAPPEGPVTFGALIALAAGVDDLGMCDGGDMERRRLLLATLGVGAFAASASLSALIDLALTSEPRDLADWQLAVADHLHAIRTRPPAQARDDLVVDLVRLRQQMIRPGGTEHRTAPGAGRAGRLARRGADPARRARHRAALVADRLPRRGRQPPTWNSGCWSGPRRRASACTGSATRPPCCGCWMTPSTSPAGPGQSGGPT